jgi:hypothetical protein
MLGVVVRTNPVSENPLMRATRRRHRRSARSGQATHLGKPRGIRSPRVQKVGPEHFGIVAIDPAKARSSWMFADF